MKLTCDDFVLLVLAFHSGNGLTAAELADRLGQMFERFADDLTPDCRAEIDANPGCWSGIAERILFHIAGTQLADRDDLGRWHLSSAGIIAAAAPSGRAPADLLDTLAS